MTDPLGIACACLRSATEGPLGPMASWDLTCAARALRAAGLPDLADEAEAIDGCVRPIDDLYERVWDLYVAGGQL